MTAPGELLRTSRRRAGLGLRTFAALIDQRASTVSAVESGERLLWRDDEILRRMAAVLGAEASSSFWQNGKSTNGKVHEPEIAGGLAWWWTSEDSPALDRHILDRQAIDELSDFLALAATDTAEGSRETSLPCLTELAIEWRLRQLTGFRTAQVSAAPVDVEATLESAAGVELRIVPGLVPRFSVQACAVKSAEKLTIYVDRIVADSRPLASYRYLVAKCYAPAALWNPIDGADWFLELQQSGFWSQAVRDCQRFALAMLLPAGPVLHASEAAYQELIQQHGFVEVDEAARVVRNRLAEQFAVPPSLVQRRLVGWPCHIYGRIAQALAAEEPTLPPIDWVEEVKHPPVQRELFETR